MKTIFIYAGVLTAALANAAPLYHTDIFDADKCVHGRGGTWNGACACYHLDQQGGRYCDTAPTGTCQTNNDCPTDFYCQQTNAATGFCYQTSGYGPVSVQENLFVLSDSVMNKPSADYFCSSLGKGWKSASRADFACKSLGPGCLNIKKLTALKKGFPFRGFFWLENEIRLNTPQAYYADLMDGTVYRTKNDNQSTIQALCILRTEK